MRSQLSLTLFIITLLPLGLGHTLYGMSAMLILTMVVGLGLCLFSMLMVLSEYAERPFFDRTATCFNRVFFLSREKYFLAALSLLFLVVTLAINHFTNGSTPEIQDSVAQLIHARILALGTLTLPSYPLGEFFDLGVMVNDGHYYSQYPPGHMLLLLTGEWLGITCAINPLLGALSVLAIYVLTKELYNARVARIAAILCLFSTFMLRMSSEFMNHATALFCSVVFFLAFIKILKKPSFLWSVLGGIAIGYLLMTRPLTAIGLVIPVKLYSWYLLFKAPRIYFPRFIMMALAALPFLGVLLWFNQHTTGDALTLGYQKLISNRYGFGDVPSPMLQWVSQPVHTLWHGIGMAFNNLNALHWYLFTIPASSLIFIPFAFLRRQATSAEKLMLASFITLLAIYIPYYFQGWDMKMGPRFLYESIFILIIFTAYGITRLPSLVPRITPRRLGFILIGCALFSMGFTLQSLIREEGRESKLAALLTLQSRIQKPTLIFLPFDQEYWRLAGELYPVREGDTIIVAVDRGAENKKLMKLYPGYQAYQASHIGLPDERWQKLIP